MTDKQEKYLELAVIDQVKFDEISKILKIERSLVSEWWDEFKDQREYLSTLRKIWKSKFKNTSSTDTFWTFKNWYEETERKCYYCGITKKQISELFGKGNLYTKRNRGKKLEIERLEPDKPYDILENLTFSCYWCNNAKTDTFSSDEFKKIGEVIREIWRKRLAE